MKSSTCSRQYVLTNVGQKLDLSILLTHVLFTSSQYFCVSLFIAYKMYCLDMKMQVKIIQQPKCWITLTSVASFERVFPCPLSLSVKYRLSASPTPPPQLLRLVEVAA